MPRRSPASATAAVKRSRIAPSKGSKKKRAVTTAIDRLDALKIKARICERAGNAFAVLFRDAGAARDLVPCFLTRSRIASTIALASGVGNRKRADWESKFAALAAQSLITKSSPSPVSEY